MIPFHPHTKHIIAAAAGTGMLAAGFTVDGNLLAIAGAVTATVGLTLTVVGWVEKRIAMQIKAHEEREEACKSCDRWRRKQKEGRDG